MKVRGIVAKLCILLCLTSHAADIMTGLEGRWQLDGNAIDSSGNGNNGATSNMTFVTDRFGIANGAAIATAANSFIQVPTSTSLEIDGQITISSWVFTDNSFDPIGVLLAKGALRQYWEYNMKLNLLPGGQTFSYGISQGNAGPLDPVLTSNQWHQIAVTIDEGQNQMKFYLDGSLLNSTVGELEGTFPLADVSGVISAPAQHGPLYLGNNNENGEPGNFRGIFDDVRIYSRALSAEDVGALYATESVPEPSRAGLLVAGVALVVLRRRR